MRGGRGVRGVTRALLQSKLLGQGAPLPILQETPDAIVQSRGVALVPQALSKQAASALHSFVMSELHRCSVCRRLCTKQEEWFTPGIFQTRAGKSDPQTRWDLRLKLAPAVWDAVVEVLQSPVGQALALLAGGKDAEVWELSCVISSPGSVPQLLHSDTDVLNEPQLFTVFVALQDVSFSMGPTRFLPGSHCARDHVLFRENASKFLQNAFSEVAILNAGDAAIYDGRLLHGGGSNNSEMHRALLTITARSKYASCKGDTEDSRSIRTLYKRARLRLEHFTETSEIVFGTLP